MWVTEGRLSTLDSTQWPHRGDVDEVTNGAPSTCFHVTALPTSMGCGTSNLTLEP